MVQNDAQNRDKKAGRKLGSSERDVLTLGIAIAAIIMFVGAGGSVLPQVLRPGPKARTPPMRSS